MKIECSKDRLREAVNLVERLAGKNLSLPILSSVLMEVQKGILSLKATNLDVGLEIALPVKADGDIRLAVKASVLVNFLNNLGDEEKVVIEENEGNLKIYTQKTSATIKCYPADDFPVIPVVKEGEEFNMSAKDLSYGIKSVLYAASLSDIKPEIASVYIYKDENTVVFVSTDSFRLAEKRLTLNNKINEIEPIILPIKNAVEILRVFENNNDILKIKDDKHQISFFADNIHLTSRLIDGTFPDYRQIMPIKFKTEICLKREDVSNALKLSNIFTDRFNQVNLKIDPTSKTLQLNSSNQDVGENSVTVQAEEAKGEAIEVSFNAKYIIDCFQSVGTEPVWFKFNEKNRPMFISSEGDNNFRYIVMPINR